MDAPVLFQPAEPVCTVTMNRPGIMNAFNLAVMEGLQDAFERIASHDGIRVAVLQGAGGNFSAGADMFLLHEGNSAPEALVMLQSLGRLIRTMRELPKPIIAKVRGAAYGVGANLALASDLVVASHEARFCEVFVKIGVVMDGGGTYFLPRLVGLAKARELALLGEEVDGRRAASMGLIYKAVPDPELDSQVEALADVVARKPQGAVGLIKQGLEGSLGSSLGDVLEWEAAHQAVVLQTAEHKEAVRRFLELRGKKVR